MKPITLTPLTAKDAPEMFEVLSAPEIYTYLDEAAPASVADLAKRYSYLERQESPDKSQTWLNWIVRDDATGHAMGYVQATIERNTRYADIGYVFHPRYWGQGLAYRAVSMMLGTLHREYAVSAYAATVDETNARSIKLLQIFGFENVTKAPNQSGGTELTWHYRIYEHCSQFGWEGDDGVGDQLIAQIIAGTKTATAGPLTLLTDAELAALRASAGKRATVIDKDGNPRCTIRNTDVFTTTFGDPDPRLLKGEGYGANVTAFQRSHKAAWADLVTQGRLQLDASTVLIVELFERVQACPVRTLWT